jgi:hypothetical protein
MDTRKANAAAILLADIASAANVEVNSVPADKMRADLRQRLIDKFDDLHCGVGFEDMETIVCGTVSFCPWAKAKADNPFGPEKQHPSGKKRTIYVTRLSGGLPNERYDFVMVDDGKEIVAVSETYSD